MDHRYIVTGSRDWYCPDVAERVLHAILARHGDGSMIVVHGAAKGVDTAFSHICKRYGIREDPHPADWIGLGSKAGPIRNQAMVDAGAVYAIAVHPDLFGSKGTLDCVRRCLKAGITVYLIDNVNPTRRIKSEDIEGAS